MRLSDKVFKYLNILTGLFVLIFLLVKGMHIGEDTSGYLETDPIRSAGYSSVILFFQFIFEIHYLYVIFLVQLAFVLFSIYYFLNFIKDRFQLTNFTVFLISFIYFYYYLKFAGNISTEPLSYAFFLLFVKFFLEALFDSNKKSLFISYGLLIILVLIRGQFYFLYPVVIVVLLFLFFKNRDWKFLLKNLSYFFISIIIANLLDKTYHYIRHDKFVGTPFMGLQLVTDALYVSKQSDSIAFEGINKEMYIKISKKITDQGFTLESLKKNISSVSPSQIIFHYNHAYNEICHRNAKVIVGSYFKNPKKIEYWENIDEITIEMAKKIIIRNPFDFIKIFVYDILRNGFFSNSILIFFIIGLVYSVRFMNTSLNNELFIFLIFASLLVIMNYLLVALVEPILQRYTFYTSVIYYTSLFIFISKVNKIKIKEI